MRNDADPDHNGRNLRIHGPDNWDLDYEAEMKISGTLRARAIRICAVAASSPHVTDYREIGTDLGYLKAGPHTSASVELAAEAWLAADGYDHQGGVRDAAAGALLAEGWEPIEGWYSRFSRR